MSLNLFVFENLGLCGLCFFKPLNFYFKPQDFGFRLFKIHSSKSPSFNLIRQKQVFGCCIGGYDRVAAAKMSKQFVRSGTGRGPVPPLPLTGSTCDVPFAPRACGLGGDYTTALPTQLVI